MTEEVRFTVSDETEAVLQKVMKKLNLSRNQVAHYCMSFGLAAMDQMIPDIDQELVAQRVAERMAPAFEKTLQGALMVVLQPENLKRILHPEDLQRFVSDNQSTEVKQ